MEIAIIALLVVLVIGAVAAPLVRGGRGQHADAREFALDAPPPAANPAATPAAAARKAAGPADAASGDALEAEIARYRAALTAGTRCSRCGEANPGDAKFCGECGKALPASEAQEFAK